MPPAKKNNSHVCDLGWSLEDFGMQHLVSATWPRRFVRLYGGVRIKQQVKSNLLREVRLGAELQQILLRVPRTIGLGRSGYFWPSSTNDFGVHLCVIQTENACNHLQVPV